MVTLKPDVVEAFRPIARRIAADAARLDERIDFRHPDGAANLDRLSLAEYLRRVGAVGWIGQLLEVAYVIEFGLDAGEQSALNLPVYERQLRLLSARSVDGDPRRGSHAGWERVFCRRALQP
jgi:hypothetical protein